MFNKKRKGETWSLGKREGERVGGRERVLSRFHGGERGFKSVSWQQRVSLMLLLLPLAHMAFTTHTVLCPYVHTQSCPATAAACVCEQRRQSQSRSLPSSNDDDNDCNSLIRGERGRGRMQPGSLVQSQKPALGQANPL